MKTRILPLLLTLVHIVPPLVHGRTNVPNPERVKTVKDILKTCGLPQKQEQSLLSFLYEDARVIYGRNSQIRDGVAGEKLESPDLIPIDQQSLPNPTLITRYESELSYQNRMKASERLLKLLWLTHDPVKDKDLPRLAQRLAGNVTATLCNSSGCDQMIRERLLIDMEKIADGFVERKWQPRGATNIGKELNINIEGLNSILANPDSPLDLNYFDYVNHYAALIEYDGGPLMMMPAIQRVMGAMRLEADVRCDDKSNCRIEPHPVKITSYQVRTAVQEMRQLLSQQWIYSLSHTTYHRDSRKNRVIDFYRFSPLTVMAVHEKFPEFDEMLCPFLQLSEATFGHEKSLDLLKGTALSFSGRVSFWLSSGLVGSMGMLSIAGGPALGPAALLTVATTIMAGLTVAELYHRIDVTGRKSTELLKLRQSVASNGASSERAHMLGYMGRNLEREQSTTTFIAFYESATLAATLGLAKLLVRMIPKSYASRDQIGKLVLQAGLDKNAQKLLIKRFGTSDYVQILKLWPKLAPAVQTQAILEMRAQLYFARYVFYPYFIKEMYDAWYLYPEVLDFPGNAKISCGPEQVFFRDARCHAYCESRNDPQTAYRCRDL